MMLVVGLPLQDVQVPMMAPDEQEAASVARTLVLRESLTNVNTFKSTRHLDGSVTKVPVSTMEYYADCDNDGNPYWLVVDVGSTYQNILQGSDLSMTIRVGDHPANDDVDPNYPGGIAASPAGSPRLNLFGRLTNVTFDNFLDQVKLEACFVKRHPDSKFWLPSNKLSPHATHWAKFVVDDVYFVGGFGGRAYIGEIHNDTYHNASPL